MQRPTVSPWTASVKCDLRGIVLGDSRERRGALFSTSGVVVVTRRTVERPRCGRRCREWWAAPMKAFADRTGDRVGRLPGATRAWTARGDELGDRTIGVARLAVGCVGVLPELARMPAAVVVSVAMRLLWRKRP